MDKLTVALAFVALIAVAYWATYGEDTSEKIAIAKTYVPTSTTAAQPSEKDVRCAMRFPLAEGGCGQFFGAYYDGWKDECINLTGCALKGRAPFNTSLSDPYAECASSCLKH